MKVNTLKYLSVLIITAILFGSCKRYVEPEWADDVDLSLYPQWTYETHGKIPTPNYAEVFEHTKVLRFDIVIDSSLWNTMQKNLSDLATSAITDNYGNVVFSESPITIPCSFYYNGRQWYNVGIKLKGTNSLYDSYRYGINKTSFKLDFEEYEDIIPGLKNQRFYGFRQLNLYNNANDKSMMREKVISDLYRSFGINTPKASFCEVYVNYGKGSKYFGIYTLIEDIDDTMLDMQFGNSNGNLYEPTGLAGTFAENTFNTGELGKANNIMENNFSDIETLYNILHSTDRMSDTTTWKKSIESIFNVNLFLKSLAANTVVENRDSYGNNFKNYYLYNYYGFVWIPFDFNKTLISGKKSALSLSMNNVSVYWPLINNLLSIKEYKNTYHNYLDDFSSAIYTPESMALLYTKYKELLQEHIYAEQTGFTWLSNSQEFDLEVEKIKLHSQYRQGVVQAYINSIIK